ncbi:MAG: hypothetical protein ACE5E7_06510 [Anaerolineae bacterium]
MNGNYDWQKHQVNERIQARLNEAEIHRSVNKSQKSGILPPLSLLAILLVGFIFFLNACQSSGLLPALAAPNSDIDAAATATTQMHIRDRIRFQDRLFEQSVLTNPEVSTGKSSVMADRIRFHDQLLEQSTSSGVIITPAEPTFDMAARIHFQDQLSMQRP